MFRYKLNTSRMYILIIVVQSWSIQTQTESIYFERAVKQLVKPLKMDGWVKVLRPFNSISVISRQWKDEHERLCAMKRRLGSGRISPPAGFEPATRLSRLSASKVPFLFVVYEEWFAAIPCIFSVICLNQFNS